MMVNIQNHGADRAASPSRQKGVLLSIYLVASACLAVGAGGWFGPMLVQREDGLAFGIQAVVTAMVALPAGYAADGVVGWLARCLTNTDERRLWPDA